MSIDRPLNLFWLSSLIVTSALLGSSVQADDWLQPVGEMGIGMMSVEVDSEELSDQFYDDRLYTEAYQIQGGLSLGGWIDLSLIGRRWGAWDSEDEDPDKYDRRYTDFEGISFGGRVQLSLPTPWVRPFVYRGRHCWHAAFVGVHPRWSAAGCSAEQGYGLLLQFETDEERVQVGLEYQTTDYDGLHSDTIMGVVRANFF